MSETVIPADIRPVRPHARPVRAALRAAGLEHHVEKVTTSRRYCRVRLRLDRASDVNAEAVAAAVRPLWHDGDTRVTIPFRWVVVIDVAHWYNTVPNTAAGLARLAEREQERCAALLAARDHGRRLYGPDGAGALKYAPADDDPRRPWVDRAGRRYTPFQVYAL